MTIRERIDSAIDASRRRWSIVHVADFREWFNGEDDDG